MLDIERIGIRLGRFDDKRAERPELLLKPRVAVVPIGSTLADRKPIGKQLPRRNAAERHPRDPIHRGRQDQPVPVNRSVFVEQVEHAQHRVLTLAEANGFAGYRPVDGDGLGLTTSDLDCSPLDDEVGRLKQFGFCLHTSSRREPASVQRQQCASRAQTRQEVSAAECWVPGLFPRKSRHVWLFAQQAVGMNSLTVIDELFRRSGSGD